MKKGKVEKIIDIIFWIIILGTIISSFIEMFHEDFDKTGMMIEREGMEFIVKAYLSSLLFAIFFALFKSIYVIVIYIGFKIAIKKFNKERMTKIDFRNDTYYRDIIQKLSPAVLSYIDDFEIDKKDVAATVVSLELKNKIRITDTIEILDYNDDDLTKNEQYVFYSIKNKSMKAFDMIVFKNIVMEECIENKLLSIKNGIFQNPKKLQKVLAIAMRNFYIKSYVRWRC